MINLIVFDPVGTFKDRVEILLKVSSDIKLLSYTDKFDGLRKINDAYKPDIILVQSSDIGEKFFKLNRELREANPRIKIIISSVEDDAELITAMMNQQIEAIIKLDQIKDGFENIVKTVCSGSFVLDNSLYDLLRQNNVTLKALTVQSRDYSKIFTKREKEIINIMLSGITKSNELSEELNISRFTIDQHKRNILKKTGFSNSKSFIKHLKHLGFEA